MEEPAWSTRAIGLADWATADKESAEPIGLYLHGKNLNFHASAVLQYENYAHLGHSQMLVELTCWPFDFYALEYAKFRIWQNSQ